MFRTPLGGWREALAEVLPSLGSCRRRRLQTLPLQISQSNQVVSRAGPFHPPAYFFPTAESHFAQQSDSFHLAEALFHPLALLLTDRVVQLFHQQTLAAHLI